MTQYHLTVRVKNAAGVAAELVQDVVVTDVNDESPTFIAVDSGSVLENSAPHTYVLKIQVPLFSFFLQRRSSLVFFWV